MSPITIIWILSAAGALLFFWAGRLHARSTAVSPIEGAPEPRDVRLEYEVQQARERASREERLEAQRSEAERALVQLRAEAEGAARSLEALTREHQGCAPRLQAEREQRAELTRSSARDRTEVETLRRRLAAPPVAPPVAPRPDPPRRVGGGTPNEALRQDLAVQRELANRYRVQIQGLAEQKSSLQQSLAEMEGLARRVQELTAENRELRAQRLAPPARRSSAPPQPRSGVHGRALQALVDRVGEIQQVRAAVITDDLGLLVAGAGEHAEALAALGAHLTGAGARASEVLPVRAIQEVSVQDDHDVRVVARRLDVADSELTLVTLGLRRGPDSLELAELIQRYPL